MDDPIIELSPWCRGPKMAAEVNTQWIGLRENITGKHHIEWENLLFIIICHNSSSFIMIYHICAHAFTSISSGWNGWNHQKSMIWVRKDRKKSVNVFICIPIFIGHNYANIIVSLGGLVVCCCWTKSWPRMCNFLSLYYPTLDPEVHEIAMELLFIQYPLLI